MNALHFDRNLSAASLTCLIDSPAFTKYLCFPPPGFSCWDASPHSEVPTGPLADQSSPSCALVSPPSQWDWVPEDPLCSGHKGMWNFAVPSWDSQTLNGVWVGQGSGQKDTECAGNGWQPQALSCFLVTPHLCWCPFTEGRNPGPNDASLGRMGSCYLPGTGPLRSRKDQFVRLFVG
jgi:hypothetical protein